MPSTRSTSGIAAKAAGLGLRGAAGDDQPRVRVVAAQPADLLAGLAHRLGGHGAGVDDHGVAEAGGRGEPLHRLGLVGVEPAAEGGEDRRRSCQRREEVRRRAGPRRPASSGRSSRRRRRASRSRASPPSSRTVTRRPVRPRRAVTTAAAQAPEPQASVIMPPRSQTRMRMVSRSITCDELDVGALGEQRVVLDPRRRCRRRRPPRRPARRRRSADCPCRRARGARRAAAASSVHRAGERHLVPVELRRAHVDPDQAVAGVLGAQHAAPGAEVERRGAGLVHQQPRDAAGGVAAGVGRACRRRSRSRPRPPRPRPSRTTASWSKPTPRWRSPSARASAGVTGRRRRRGRRSRRSRCRARASSGTEDRGLDDPGEIRHPCAAI